MKILTKSFYNRPPDIVAHELLGKILVFIKNNYRCSGKIVETEAYFVENDPANHAARGRTKRNEPMFGKPGTAYVYFCYGNHWLINAVTEKEGIPSAVLIRAIEPVEGIEKMRLRRGVNKDTDLTNGPAKLCAALGITGAQNKISLLKKPLMIFSDSNPLPVFKTSERIGISTGTQIKGRYYIPGNKFVSGRSNQ
ncbi:MAG: DNA-3-methyladenine glycosylase [Victivallaceae bacterium]|nr:DNA-3-methyladenine glycosylase [Victivallaceae bacterium]